MMSLIDNYNKKVWIYFLKEKYESFTFFKQHNSQVGKDSRSTLCYLRTDRGVEFTSNKFNQYCKKHDIKMQLTAAYTLQLNGIA